MTAFLTPCRNELELDGDDDDDALRLAQSTRSSVIDVSDQITHALTDVTSSSSTTSSQ